MDNNADTSSKNANHCPVRRVDLNMDTMVVSSGSCARVSTIIDKERKPAANTNIICDQSRFLPARICGADSTRDLSVLGIPNQYNLSCAPFIYLNRFVSGFDLWTSLLHCSPCYL